MSWLGDRAGDAAAIVAELGEQITYTPFATNTPITLTAIVHLTTTTIATPKGGRRAILHGHIRILPSLATTPDVRDLFTARGINFAATDEPTRDWLVAWTVEQITEHRVLGTPNRIQR